MKYVFFICLILCTALTGCYMIYPIPVESGMEILVTVPVDAIFENLEVSFQGPECEMIPAQVTKVYDYYDVFEEPLYDELTAERRKLATVIVPEGIPPASELSIYFVVVEKVIRDVVIINPHLEARESDPVSLIEKYREKFSNSPFFPQLEKFLESRELSGE